ncbi:unnamed protein product, partial [Discosporangium mesarthrocarpum]
GVLSRASLPPECLHRGDGGKIWAPGFRVDQDRRGGHCAACRSGGGGLCSTLSSVPSSATHAFTYGRSSSSLARLGAAARAGVAGAAGSGAGRAKAVCIGCWGATPRRGSREGGRGSHTKECCRCLPEKTASAYHVSFSPDGREILTASNDSTVTIWDSQTRMPVYGFGHPRLSLRARPVLSPATLGRYGADMG